MSRMTFLAQGILNPSGLCLSPNARCRLCGQPANEVYRYWVGWRGASTRNTDIGNSDRVIESTTFNLTPHDAEVCQACQDQLWRDDTHLQLMIGVLCLGVSGAMLFLMTPLSRFLLETWIQLVGTAKLSGQEAKVFKVVVAGTALGFAGWGLVKLLSFLRTRTYQKMESLVLKKFKPQHRGEGPFFFTNSEHQGAFGGYSRM